MKKRIQTLLALPVGAALAMILTSCGTSTNKSSETKVTRKHLKGYFKRKPWKEGGHKQARAMALARRSGTPIVIPMSSYSRTASKDGMSYSGTIVGASPFATPLAGSTTNLIVILLKISIGSATFDAGAPDSCDGNVSALTRFKQSPLVNPVPGLTINGVNVGNVQFINGFRRATFWNTIHGSAAYQNVRIDLPGGICA